MYEKIIVGACDKCKHGNKEIFQRPCARCFDTYVMGGKEGTCFEQKEERITYYDRFIYWYTRLWKVFAHGESDKGTNTKRTSLHW